MQWIKLPEMERGKERAHWFAYCWSCQRDKFLPGMFLCSQLYFNPFIHTEPICENCARGCDPNFGKGTRLTLDDLGRIIIHKGDERECDHSSKKSYFPIISREVVLACSWDCARSMGGSEEESW